VKHSAFLPRALSSSKNVSRVAIGAALALAVGCAKVTPSSQSGGGGGSSNPSGSGGSNGTGAGGFQPPPPPPPCQGTACTDFPSDPIIDPTAPSGAPGMFSGSPPASGGPCIVEPEDGTLFPNNWLRPRVRYTGANGKLVQITMSADNQANTLTAYTMPADGTWTMPKDIWNSLRGHQTDNRVTVTVWVQGGGASTTHFSTAPVGASGNLVFWAANPMLVGAMPPDCYKDLTLCANASQLRGFSVGDESTVEVLGISQVAQMSRKDDGNLAPVICIGCHAGTPDDGFVSFTDHYPWRAAVAGVASGMTGVVYPTLTAAGLAALQQPGWGPLTYTKSNGAMTWWATGKKIGIGSLGLKDPTMPDASNGPDQNDSPHLAWLNLEAPTARPHVNGDWSNWAYPSYTAGAGIDSGNSLGFMMHTGDAGGAATPNWSHDGMTVAYVSTNASISGRLNMETANPMPNSSDPYHNATQQNANAARKPGMTDIYSVPFNNGLGGAATPVMGAATTDHEEYYPAYSPDDEFIAFTRVPAGEVMYANAHAEIAVVSAKGGAATVLAANSPPACTGKTSPGVNNHWPKWSPEVQASSKGTFYWLIFSSNRADLPPQTAKDGHLVTISQLYMSPVVVTEAGINPYPAIYLWNQPTTSVNTTPAWETFSIPPVQ
jgi:hypothetical protein